MGNASGPTLLSSSSDEDGPEDQTRTWLPPQVAGPSSLSGPPTRKHPSMRYQDSGFLVCQYCPFRTNLQTSMASHSFHHTANYPFKCKFCSFSSKHKISITTHMNRVHKEKMVKKETTNPNHQKSKLKRPSTNSTLPVDDSDIEEIDSDVEMSDVEDETSTVEIFHVDGIVEEPPQHQSEDPLNVNVVPQNRTDKEVEEVVNIPKIPKKVEVVDLCMDTDDEEDPKVPVPQEVSCFCGQRHPKNGGNLLVSCDGCDGRFHGSCVKIPEANGGVDWLCPRCVKIEPPVKHQSKLIKAIDSLAQQFRTRASESEHQNEEETICRAEMATLAKDIKEAQIHLWKKEKSLKEDTGKLRESRIKKLDKFREMVEELELKDRGLAIERRVYLDQKKDVDKQLTDLTTEKIQLERELVKLKGSSVNKEWIKLEPSCSHSSAAISGNREAILEKEARLCKVQEELLEILKRDTYLSGRMVVVEETIAETVKTLLEVRTDYNSLKDDPSAAGTSSATVDQLKTFKEEQRNRIAEFARLERKLVKLSYGHVFDEIRRKEEEWVKALDDEGHL